MKRHIRLKEFEPLSETTAFPTEDYPADSSIERRSYAMRADRNGFLRTGNALPPPVASIVFLGDSVIENSMVAEDERVCSRLERALYASGLRVAVLNGGYSGATTLHALNVFLNKIARLRPLAVVYMSGVVDGRICYRPEKFWSPLPEITPLVGDEDGLDLENCSFDGAALTALLTLMEQAAAAVSIPIWFATTPRLQNPDAEYIQLYGLSRQTFDGYAELSDGINEEKRSLFGGPGRPFFDIDKAFTGEAGWLYDLYHLNAIGSRMAAEAFIAQGFISEVARALARRSLPA
jgi:lysophospholipase L1-like esterase